MSNLVEGLPVFALVEGFQEKDTMFEHQASPVEGLPLQQIFHEEPSDVGDTSSLDGEPIDPVQPMSSLAPASRDNAIYDMSNGWLMSLQSVWREHATREISDESRVIYIETWYLHHNTRPRCARSRTLRLDNADHYWLDDIRRVWHDVLAGGEPLQLAIVNPTPPRADSQRSAAHVLLTQGMMPNAVGVIFTARFIEDHQTHLIQEAVSSPD